MYLAKIFPGKEPIVTRVDDFVLLPNKTGGVIQVPREAWARRIVGGGAAALSQTLPGAIASARCVLQQDAMERELRVKRDRA